MTGAIAPVDPKAPPIRFQVNLPAAWNGSSLQFGGGGFNGVLVTGLGLPVLAPPDRPSPLALSGRRRGEGGKLHVQDAVTHAGP